jgi:ferredoxin
MDTKITKRIELKFPETLVDKPILCDLVKKYELDFNIQQARIDESRGAMVLELIGTRASYHNGVEYLKQLGIEIRPLKKVISRDDKKCTHCGACVTICPSRVFAVEPVTRKITTDFDKCTTCGDCVKYCPPHAMKIEL